MVRRRSVPVKDSLEQAAREEWEASGAHRAAQDPNLDAAVVLISDTARADEALRWLTAVGSVQRPRGDAEGPAFGLRLARASTRLARLPASDPLALPAPPANAKLAFGQPSVSGRLAPAVVSAAIEAQRVRLLRCYGVGLRVEPKLAGTVTLRFVIGTDGRIGKPATSNVALDQPETVACLLDAIRYAEFPAPPGGIVTVVVPLTFSPR
jgi:hypothetical protein